MGEEVQVVYIYFEFQRAFFQPAWHVELVESGDFNHEGIRTRVDKPTNEEFQIWELYQHDLLSALLLMLFDSRSIVDGIFALRRRIITIDHWIPQLQGFVPLIPTHWARVFPYSIASKSFRGANRASKTQQKSAYRQYLQPL